MSYSHSIKCYDCGANVSGSIKNHRIVCPNSRKNCGKNKDKISKKHKYSTVLICHDCGDRVPGSIREHRKICSKNKKS